MNYKNVIISFWYKEMLESPATKVVDLENSLKSLFDNPFLYNDMPVNENIDVPRVQCKSQDSKYLFTMSLICANLSIDVNKMDKDDILLIINENIQLIYDVLKEIYDVSIIYASIKINGIDINNSGLLAERFNLDKDCEDISFKQVKKLDNTYYECLILTTTKEVNYDIPIDGNNKPLENDLFNRSMLISSSEAKIGKEYLDIFYEINDRLAYNLDKEYLTTKENIRGLIMEVKKYLALKTKDIK